MNESCHTYKSVMSLEHLLWDPARQQMSHVTHMNESCRTHMSESCHTYECVMSLEHFFWDPARQQMSHVTHVK